MSIPRRTVRSDGVAKTNFNGSTAPGFRYSHVYIGANGTTGMPLGSYFFGRLYGLVFLTREVDAGTLSRIERQLSDKTGVALP